MDFEPNSEQQMLIDQVRRYVREEIIPLEAKLDPDASELDPADQARLVEKTKAMGLYGIDIPKEFGGPDIDIVTRVLLAIEMAQHRAGLYVPCYGTFGGAGLAQIFEANEDQKERYLYPTLRGEKKPFFGLTEPSGGSDPARAIQTRAERKDNGWVLNGAKIFISGADRAQYGIVFARTDASKGRAGITCFIVDADTPGFHVRRVVHTLRSSSYATELEFKDCWVSDHQVLGEVNKGFAVANDRLTRQRIPYAAGCIGVAIAAHEMAIEWAKMRSTFGEKLANRQAVQWMLVDNEIDIRSAAPFHPGGRRKGAARPALPHRGRHRQADRVGGRRPGRRPFDADPRRHGHDQGPAARALVSRDAHPPGRRRPERGAAHGDRARDPGQQSQMSKPARRHQGRRVRPEPGRPLLRADPGLPRRRRRQGRAAGGRRCAQMGAALRRRRCLEFHRPQSRQEVDHLRSRRQGRARGSDRAHRRGGHIRAQSQGRRASQVRHRRR